MNCYIITLLDGHRIVGLTNDLVNEQIRDIIIYNPYLIQENEDDGSRSLLPIMLYYSDDEFIRIKKEQCLFTPSLASDSFKDLYISTVEYDSLISKPKSNQYNDIISNNIKFASFRTKKNNEINQRIMAGDFSALYEKIMLNIEPNSTIH